MKNFLISLVTVFALTGCLSGGGGTTDTTSPTAPTAPVVTPPADVVTPPPSVDPVADDPSQDPADPQDEDPVADPTPYAFTGGGAGTVSDPYTLLTPVDVAHIKDFPAAQFELVQDINMAGATFEPIASFSGVLYGNNFIIHHFSIAPTSGTAAMFQSLSGTVIQLKLQNVTVTGTAYAASIAGALSGMISSCSLYSVNIASPTGGNGVNTGVGRPFYVTKTGGASVIGSTYDVFFNGYRIMGSN